MSAIGVPVDIIAIGAALWAGAFSASLIATLVGAGGGLIIIPIMHFVFTQMGLDNSTAMLLTVGTSACSMLFTGPRAIARHHRIKNIDWDVVKHMAPPVLLGALLTHALGFSSDAQILKIVFAVMAAAIGLYLLLGHERWRYADHVPLGPKWWAFSLVLGMLCPLVGITGTVIAIPAMVACGMSLRRSIGTGSVLTLMIGIPSTAVYAMAAPIDFPFTLGLISIPTVLIIALASYFAIPLGVRMQQKIPSDILRVIFALLLFVSSGRFMWLALS